MIHKLRNNSYFYIFMYGIKEGRRGFQIRDNGGLTQCINGFWAKVRLCQCTFGVGRRHKVLGVGIWSQEELEFKKKLIYWQCREGRTLLKYGTLQISAMKKGTPSLPLRNFENKMTRLLSLLKVPMLCLDESKSLFNDGLMMYPRTYALPRYKALQKIK